MTVPVAILDTARVTGAAATVTSSPILIGKTTVGTERTSAARPVMLDVKRDRDGTTGALDGTIAVYGANLPNPDMDPNGISQVFKGDGIITALNTAAAAMLYAAFLNNNFIVIQNGVVLVQGAGAGKFTLLDVDGGTSTSKNVRIVLGTAAPANARIEVYKVTPVEVLADGAYPFNRSQVQGKTAMWTLITTTAGAYAKTLVQLEPLGV